MKVLSKKQKALFLVGLLSILILTIGGTYAYFSVNTTVSTNGADITGSAKDLGTPAMKTVTSNLYLNLNASLMSQDNAGITYFANSDSAGTALTTNPNYTLAEVSLTNGTNALDCTYNFKVTATVTKAISDGSDSDVKVVIGDQTLTLNKLITAGTDGVIVSGNIKNLVTGTNQIITLSSSVTNTANTQDNLVDNTYTITVEPYSNGDTKAFSCKLRYQFSSEKSLAQNLIDSEWLWQSGLEGDGYRFTGSSKGKLCSYNSGDYYVEVAIDESCPAVYYGGLLFINAQCTNQYAYNTNKNVCSDTIRSGQYLYQCKEYTAESPNIIGVPNNFICFGTTDKDTCTSNPSTYMYRIIGVFADENGDYHVKLIKYTQLSTAYAWHSTKYTDTDWADSDLYKGLNGSYFLTNTTYSYMQDNTWLSKITDWKWTAVNTLTYESSGPNYVYDLSPSYIYLHEMNRSTKTSTIGEWTTPTAKIGLMYASDYALSLGATALTMTTSTSSNASTLKIGWMHQSNNDTTASQSEWTISRVGTNDSVFGAYRVDSGGAIRYDYYNAVTSTFGARSVLYLESDIKSSSGDGSLSNPYVLN